MNDITPASLRATADWLRKRGWVDADGPLCEEAARLEAESARDEEAEKLAEVMSAAMDPGSEWSLWPAGVVERRKTAARAVLAFLAADGRLLLEGGTGEAACLVCGRDTPPRGLTTWRDADGESHWVHPECHPMAASVPDDAADGTPEKPWPTWQDVPEGAVYQSHLSGAQWRYENRCGLPYAFGENAVVAGGYLNQHLAPFVRVDGDKA